jgi:uncharacterized protein Veg
MEEERKEELLDACIGKERGRKKRLTRGSHLLATYPTFDALKPNKK